MPSDGLAMASGKSSPAILIALLPTYTLYNQDYLADSAENIVYFVLLLGIKQKLSGGQDDKANPYKILIHFRLRCCPCPTFYGVGKSSLNVVTSICVRESF